MPTVHQPTALRQETTAAQRVIASRGATRRPGTVPGWFLLAALLLAAAAGVSLFVGVADVSPSGLLDPATRPATWDLLVASRGPRTVALVLAGGGLAVCGVIMQLLTRNPFVEPATAGTMEAAGLGILLMTIAQPHAPVVARMLAGAVCAVLGTGLFLAVLSRLALRDLAMVPVVGLVLGGVLSAVATFVAYRTDLLQSLGAWMTADFSAVIEGRYELLWLAAVLVGLGLLVADRFTVAGLGEEVATSLGLDHRAAMALGLGIVALTSAVVVVTVGALPFVGLVVPNLVATLVGGNARRTIPLCAVCGALLVVVCDLLARTLRAPYELPVGLIIGVLGGVAFLVILLRRTDRVA